jgi:hypothetical protein
VKRIFGIICLVLACVGIFNQFKFILDNKPDSSSGSKAYDSGKKIGRYGAPGVLLAIGIRLLLSGDSSRSSSMPRRTSNSLPPPGDPSLRGGMNTFASNPARLRLDWMKWIASRTDLIILGALAICFGLWMTFFIHPIPGLCILAAVSLAFFKFISEVKGKFFKGDVCPGIVVSENPGLVGVLTNLAADGGARPAIKIVRAPVKKISATIGTRVAAVAQYRPPVREGAWSDFSPEVINFGVSDPAEIQRAFESISAEEWQALDETLARIQNPSPGLYRMWGAHFGAATRPSTSFLTSKPMLIALGALAFLVMAVYSLHFLITGMNTHRVAPVARQNYSAPHSRMVIPGMNPQPPPQTATPAPTPAQATRRPMPTSVELNNQIVTVTNLSGRVYENIKLVRADYSGVIYLTDAGGGRIPLSLLPLEFLAQIGVPTNWPGVGVPANAAPVAPTSPGFGLGSRVSVQWAGRWESGTIVELHSASARVRMDNPTYHFPFWFSTNLLHLQ